LDQDYVRRPSAAGVLKHKFFMSVRSKEPLGASVIANLQQFTSNTKFKLKVLNVMADKLSDPQELEEMKATFKAMDVNNDGTISTEELMTFLKNSGVSDGVAKEQMADMMKNVDMDGDGTISYDELVMTLMDRKIQAKEERLWSAFCKLDKDLDGEITATEIMDVLKVSKEEAEKYIQEIDVNKDGKITYDEFSAMWMARDEL
jgi:calcium-dependent protein kinase